jgi:protoporphyrinogen oxidase
VKPVTFEQWIDRNLGKGIGEMFMHPYNFKVWGVRTSEVGRESSEVTWTLEGGARLS